MHLNCLTITSFKEKENLRWDFKIRYIFSVDNFIQKIETKQVDQLTSQMT